MPEDRRSGRSKRRHEEQKNADNDIRRKSEDKGSIRRQEKTEEAEED